MSSDSDLSDYERIRLDNIRRNNEFLAQLGLAPLKPKIVSSIKVEGTENSRKSATKNKRDDKPFVSDEKRRRSSRLSGNFVKVEDVQDFVDATEVADETKDETAFYDRTPHESDQLDDFEFQAFVELRKWRLLRSRELSIAPYGLFQNRTFCEMIRRRRNDATWATERSPSEAAADFATTTTPADDVSELAAGIEKSSTASMKTEVTISPLRSSPRKIKTVTKEAPTIELDPQSPHSLSIVYNPSLVDALTECFGIAAGKTKEGGYAWEALAVLNTHKVMHLLQQSRSMHPRLDEATTES